MFKHKDQRVGVFIDTQNMYYSARNIFHRKVNFKNIVLDAVADRKLIRAIAYVVATEDGQEKPFFDALEKAGIEAKAKDLQEFSSGAKKADWDVGLAIDVVQTLDVLDVVIIVSGDGDFQPLVNYVQARGRLVEIMAFGQTTSSALRSMVKEFTDLSENKRRYLIGPKLPDRGPAPPAGGKPDYEAVIMTNTKKPIKGLQQPERDISEDPNDGKGNGFFMELDDAIDDQEASRSRRLEF